MMLTVSLKINPFTNEVSVQKDGKPIKPTNRLSGFYKSFFNTALNLKEIILEDENVDSFHVSLEASMFERMFLGALSGKDINGEGEFQVQRKDFLVSTSLEKRIESLFAFRKKYSSGAHPIPPQEINVYASDPEDAELLANFLNEEYPWLRDIGIILSASSRVVNTQINFFANRNEIANNAKFLSAAVHDLMPMVFCSPLSLKGLIGKTEIDGDGDGINRDEEDIDDFNEEENGKAEIAVENGVVIWNVEPADAGLIIKNYFERYFIYPKIDKIISNFHPGIDIVNNFDEYVEYQLLNKVFETVIVKVPDEIEKGTTAKIPIKTFFGDARPKFVASSNYRDILEAECNEDFITLKAWEVGDSDIKIEMVGELTPILSQNVKVVDFGYATEAKICMEDDANAERFITTPGSRVKLSLKYEPQTAKAAEDAKNAVWVVSDEKFGFFDKESMMFHAQAPGNVKVVAQLARKQASFPIIIKPNVTDYTLSVINESDDHICEIRKSDEDQSVEYIRCCIATPLRFKLVRHPEGAINSPIAIEFTDGIGVEKNAEENGFTVHARRVGKGEIIKVSLPGCSVVKTIIIDVVPIREGALKDNYSATLIGASAVTAALLVLGALFLAPQNIYLLTFGGLVIAFDGYAVYKADKSIKMIVIVFALLAVAALLFSIFKGHSQALRPYDMSNGRVSESPFLPTAPETVDADSETLPAVPLTKTLPEMKPALDSETLAWVKVNKTGSYTEYLKLREQCSNVRDYQKKVDLIMQYNRVYDQIVSAKRTGGSKLIRQKNISSEMEDFAEENLPEQFEAYSKAKKTIRSKSMMLNKAKRDGASQARLDQLQDEINEATKEFNNARKKIIKAYNSKK